MDISGDQLLCLVYNEALGNVRKVIKRFVERELQDVSSEISLL